MSARPEHCEYVSDAQREIVRLHTLADSDPHVKGVLGKCIESANKCVVLDEYRATGELLYLKVQSGKKTVSCHFYHFDLTPVKEFACVQKLLGTIACARHPSIGRLAFKKSAYYMREAVGYYIYYKISNRKVKEITAHIRRYISGDRANACEIAFAESNKKKELTQVRYALRRAVSRGIEPGEIGAYLDELIVDRVING